MTRIIPLIVLALAACASPRPLTVAPVPACPGCLPAYPVCP